MYAWVQDFKQLYDLPNPYAPSAQPRAGGADGARKGADGSRLKQVPPFPVCK